MINPLALRLGFVAGLYLFWLINWTVIGERAFGPRFYNWDMSLASAAITLTAWRTARRVGQPYNCFLQGIALGAVMLTFSWAAYDPHGLHPAFHFGPGIPDYSCISYALFVFCWLCAWSYLALIQWQRQPPSGLTKIVFAVLFAGLSIILANFYYPLYAPETASMDGRLDAAASCLEFLTLTVGLMSILLGEAVILTWMVLATALIIASDMAYSGNKVPVGVETVWMFGQLLLAAAVIALPDAVRQLDTDRRQSASSGNSLTKRRSNLSGILILLSLGGVLLAAIFGFLPIHPVWKSFSAVVFVVLFVTVQTWLTDHFDETVRFLRTFTQQIHRNRLQPGNWQDAAANIQATLRSTGLDAYLDWLSGSLRQLKQDIIFLGPERLYPPAAEPDHREKIVRCFLVMPFSQAWSGEVHQTLSASCKTLGVYSMRGDDLFTPTDILVDIWQSINAADFIIADITGRNPNVLYELGIAHALAKPVLLLSQSAADIPIDLSTRRVILYEQCAAPGWQHTLETRVTRAVSEIIGLYRFMEA